GRPAPRQPKERSPEPEDQERMERRRPEPRAATPARRRDRYADDDEEDFRPSRPRARKRRSSHVGLFLIVGGVIASLIMVVGCVVLAIWLFTRDETKSASRPQAVAVEDGPRMMFGPQAGDDNGPNGNDDDNKGDAAKDANVKEPEPPSP